MTDSELADLRSKAKKAIEANSGDVTICPYMLLELVRGVEWGRFIQEKCKPHMDEHINATVKKLAYPSMKEQVTS